MKLKWMKNILHTIIKVETSDFERFPNAKAYASYTGLTIGEHSSGDKNN